MNPDSVDAAWRIHAALIDWTGKVDAKASFALAIESALLGGVVTLSGGGRVFYDLSGWAMFWYVLGVSLLIAAVLCAVWVVRPRLRTANLETEAPDNFIYFGHLRHLTPETVQEQLQGSSILTVLSKQLVEMSKIAWKKHRIVQWSLSLAPMGVLALGICATY
ncbi:Pycsar system effector family protein [Corynebacterium glutamicum]|uniref:Pycsar system effector family protein n=1 Tax=Corynebacterium glutamicum TaxID=1718 RepID=UPI000A8A35A5|nr:Pycsar system effector family protein [Corynebacterium glutamicum]